MVNLESGTEVNSPPSGPRRLQICNPGWEGLFIHKQEVTI